MEKSAANNVHMHSAALFDDETQHVDVEIENLLLHWSNMEPSCYITVQQYMHECV